jgi:4-alpha-glucanotransferase
MKGEEILQWLKIISEHLGTIGSELKQVRNILESKVFSLPQNNSSPKSYRAKPEVIPLDLEAFAAKKKNNGPKG